MARIPDETTLGVPRKPGARPRRRANASDYGDGSGLRALAAGIGRMGAGMERRAKEQQAERMAAASLEYQVAVTDTLYSPDGYLSQHGADAAQGYDGLEDTLETKRREIAEKHGLEDTEEWDRRTLPDRESARRRGATHARSQEVQSRTGEATAQMQALRGNALDQAGNPDAVAGIIAQQERLAAETSDYMGHTQAEREANVAATVGNTAAVLITDRLNEGDYTNAQQYWEQYGEFLNPEQRTKLEPQLYEAGVIDTFTRAVDEVGVGLKARDIIDEDAPAEPAEPTEPAEPAEPAAPEQAPSVDPAGFGPLPATFRPGFQDNIQALGGEGVISIEPAGDRTDTGLAILTPQGLDRWRGEALRHGVEVTATPELSGLLAKKMVQEHRVRVADVNNQIAPYVRPIPLSPTDSTIPVQPIPRHPSGSITDISPYVRPVNRQVVDSIIQIESGFKANAKNPLSSATGYGQFIDSTWERFIREERPELGNLLRRERLALRSDLELSREAVEWYARETAMVLERMGVTPTPGAMYLGHFLGQGGARKAYSAPLSAPVERVLGSAVVNSNPFLRGRSIGWMLDWAERKMAGASGSIPATPGTATAPVPANTPDMAPIRIAAAGLSDTRWLEWAEQQSDLGSLPAEQQLAAREDPARQEEASRFFEQEAEERLREADLAPIGSNRFVAELLGEDGIQVLKAKPDTKLGSLLSDRFLSAHPDLADRTVRQLLLWVDSKRLAAAMDELEADGRPSGQRRPETDEVFETLDDVPAEADAGTVDIEQSISDARGATRMQSTAAAAALARRRQIERRERPSPADRAGMEEARRVRKWLAFVPPEALLATAAEDIAANDAPGDYFAEDSFDLTPVQVSVAPQFSPPTETPAETPEAAPVVHLIERGDTLFEIARDNDMSLDELLEMNPHFADDPDMIFPGERVYLTPAETETVEAPVPPQRPARLADARVEAPVPPQRPARLSGPQAEAPVPPQRPARLSDGTPPLPRPDPRRSGPVTTQSADLSEVTGLQLPEGVQVVRAQSVSVVDEPARATKINLAGGIEALLDELFPDDERAQGIAREYYRDNMEAENKAAAEERKRARRQMERAILGGGSVDDFDRESLALVGHDFVSDMRALEAGDGTGASDDEARAALNDMMARQPGRFAREDLSEWKEFLSPADYKEFSKQQQLLKANDPLATAETVTRAQAYSLMDDIFEAEEITKPEDQLKFRKALDDRIFLHKIDPAGNGIITMPEVHQIMDELLAETALTRPRFLGDPEPVRRFEVEAVPYEDIPDAERDQVENRLAEQLGRPPSEAEVEALYLEFILQSTP